MASTYSTNLKLELQGTGENPGTWGTITNTNLGTTLEQAIVGYGNPSYASDANLTLTYTDTNAAQTARSLVLNVTSAVSLTATRELVVPTIQKQYIVQNNTTGAQSITVKTSAGTGITVPNGRKAHLYVDGTNVIQMFDFVDINGGTIDGVTIGGASAGAGTFTTLAATTLGAALNANSQAITNANIDSGTIDGVTIGGASAGAGTFTNVTATGTINLSGATVSNGGSVTTVDINGGTLDGVTIGGSSAAAGTFTTLNATTIDATNLEVTNVKAKDGTAALAITDSTGKVTISTELAVDNLNFSVNAITSTNTNGNIDLTPNGTGEVNITKVDIDAGAIDGTIIGGSSAAAGTFTTLTATTLGGALNANSQAITNANIDSGTIDGVTVGGSSAGAGTFTTLNATTVDATNIEVTNVKAKDGTAAFAIADTTGKVTVSTELAVDNLNFSANAITSTNTNGNIDLTPNGTGEVNITKVDIDAGAIDGTAIGASSASTGVFTTLTATTLGGALNANSQAITNANIDSGAIDGTTVGASSASTGVFTTLTATTLGGALNANSQAITNVNIDSGAIDGTPIGANSASTGAFTTLTLSNALAVAQGGTGQTTYTNGQLLIGNTTGNTLSKSTLTAGTGISITNGAGTITIEATGGGGGGGTVTSVSQTFTGGIVSVSGSPITSSGTLAMTVAGTSGGIPYFSNGSTWASSATLAASSFVVGGGAGVAPSTTTTGTGVISAVGNSVNTSSGLVTQQGILAANAVLLGGGSGVGVSSTATGTGVVNALGNQTNTTGGFVTQSGVLASNALLLGGGSGSSVTSTTTGTGVVTAVGNGVNTSGGLVTQSGALALNSLLIGGGSGSAVTSTTTGTGVVTALSNTTNSTGGFTTVNGTATLTNKRVDPRVATATSASTLTPDVSTADIYAYTALAAPLTINAPIGTPVDGNKLLFRFLDNGTSRSLTWNGTYAAIGVTLPNATTASKTTYVGCIYNANNTRWDVVAVTTQA